MKRIQLQVIIIWFFYIFLDMSFLLFNEKKEELRGDVGEWGQHKALYEW